jgi:hypothetical protein
MSEFVTPGHGLSGRTLTRLTRTRIRHLFFDVISAKNGFYSTISSLLQEFHPILKFLTLLKEMQYSYYWAFLTETLA